MQWFPVLFFLGTVALIVATATQKDPERSVTTGNNTQSHGSNIWTGKFGATNIGGFQYQDGKVTLFQNQLKSSDVFFTPFPYIEPNLTACSYNDFSDHTELTLVISLYTTDLLEAIERDIKKHHQDICGTQHCKVSLLPMHSIRLIQKGRRSPESQKKYTVDSEWHSNTQLLQTVEFIIYTSNMSICENLKNSITSRCSLSNFEVHYSLEGQQTAARTLEVTTEDVTKTSMYNKIKSQLRSDDQDTVALTGNDYKNLLSETMDQITMNLRIEEGFESIQDPVAIDRMLDRQLQDKHAKLTIANDRLWDSLYWTPELTRPDRLSKVLNKVMKQDATDSDKFRYDYSQADEALKQNLKLHDRQKLDNLEKHLAAQSRNTTHTSDIDSRSDHKIPLNDDVIHYVIDTKQYNGTNNERKNGTTLILQRKDAETLVRYLSEHVEVEGDIIKPKPIDVTLVKFGSLKSNTRLFSNTVYVKTRMNVHILPLRCPYKYRHRSSAIWLEEEYHRLSNVVDNLTNIVATKYDRLLNVVNNLTNIVDAKYDRLLHVVNNLTNIVGDKYNRLSNTLDAQYNRLSNTVDAKYNRLLNVVNNLTNVVDAKYDRLSNTVDTKYKDLSNVINNLTNVVDAKYDRLSKVVDAMHNELNAMSSTINQTVDSCFAQREAAFKMGDEGQLVIFDADDLATVKEKMKEMQSDNTLIAFKDLSTTMNKAIGMLPTKVIPILQRLYVSYWTTRTAIAVAFTNSSGILSEFVIKSGKVIQHGMNKQDQMALMTVENQLQPIIDELSKFIESSRTELSEIHHDLLGSKGTGDFESMKMVDELTRAVQSGLNSILSAYGKTRSYLKAIAGDKDLLVNSVIDALKFMNLVDAYMGTTRIQNIKQVLALE